MYSVDIQNLPSVDELIIQGKLLLTVEISSSLVMKFLIKRLKSLEKYIDNTRAIEVIFESNVIDAKEKAKKDF